MDVKEVEYIKINVGDQQLGLREGARPIGSIWPRKDLKISDHTLRLRIRQEWFESVDETDYIAYQKGDEPVPSSKSQPELLQPETEEEESEESDDGEEELDSEEEESEIPKAPKSPKLKPKTKKPVMQPTRDGKSIQKYWDDLKPEAGTGAICPHCETKHYQKAKLWNCCKDKGEWGEKPIQKPEKTE